MGTIAALGRLGRVRLTGRGIGACLIGVVLGAVGLALSVPDLVGVGAAALIAVGLAWIVTGLQRLDEGRGALTVRRHAAPSPVVRGERTDVRLTVGAAAPTGAAYERLARLRLSEQAAHELAGHEGIRAQVRAGADRIDVAYSLVPSRRGRWPLGPLLTSRSDVFGLVRATQPLGGTTAVPVWPRATELAVRTRALGDVDRASAGGRLQSSDDAVLREYVPGDDPRRVHWASAARRGQLLVRADESAGVRSVSVLLDRGLLPRRQDAATTAFSRPAGMQDGEWAVDLTASIATSFLDAGHPTRVLWTTRTPSVSEQRFVPTRASRHVLLDACVDVQGHRGPSEAALAAATTAHALRLDRGPSEMVLAVLGPQEPRARQELAALGADRSCWAILVTPHGRPAPATDDTLTELTAAGWHVVACEARTDIPRVWALLTEGVR